MTPRRPGREESPVPEGEPLSARRGLGGWLWRLGAALLLALCLSWLPFELSGQHGFRHYVRLRRELHGLRQRNAELARKIRRLTEEVRELREPGPAVERVARAELGLIRDGERVFVIRRAE